MKLLRTTPKPSWKIVDYWDTLSLFVIATEVLQNASVIKKSSLLQFLKMLLSPILVGVQDHLACDHWSGAAASPGMDTSSSPLLCLTSTFKPGANFLLGGDVKSPQKQTQVHNQT